MATTSTKIVYSYSNLSCYDNCAYQFYRRYVIRDIPFPDTPQIQYGNAAHKAFEYRLRDNKTLPDDMRHWEPFAIAVTPPLHVEIKLGMSEVGRPTDFWDNDVYIRGKLDCVKYNSTRAYLFDWKTGNVRERPFELAVEAMLLKVHYPKLNTIFGRYVWLKNNKLGQEYDLSDTDLAWQECNKIIALIEKSLVTNRWDKNQNPLCAYCEVLDCEYNRKPK